MNSVVIFGIPLVYGKISDLVDNLVQRAIKQTSTSCLFMNSHMLYESKKNPAFRVVVESADFICPDGMPLLYAQRLFGNTSGDRLAGNDMIFEILQAAEENKLNVSIYGSTNDVLNKISNRIKKEYSKLNFQTISPPFRELTDLEMKEYAKLINDFGTNITLVGLGCPKQEIWMTKMKGVINGSMLGLGGAFLLYAEIDSRAPKLMRDLSLEWVYRLVLEPKRLFKRYLVTNTYFCWLVVKEVFNKN